MAFLSRIKYLPCFALTCAVGIISVSNTNVEAPKKDVFTFEEAISHLNKRVRSLCNATNIRPEDTTGRTMFVEEDKREQGGYFIVIDWDYSLRGKHELMWEGKESYQRCVVEVGEFER